MDYAGHTQVANTRRNRVLASTPLLVVATIMVVLEVGSMAKGFVQRYPVYTTGKANLTALASGLSEPAARWPTMCWSRPTPTPGCCSRSPARPTAGTARSAAQTRSGSRPTASAIPWSRLIRSSRNPGTVNSDGPPDKPNVGVAFAAGTGGGYGPVGVNGSRVFLPFGLGPGPHAGDGQLRREHRGRQSHLGVVPVAAAAAPRTGRW